MVAIPFCGPSYTDRTLNANAQRSVNLYPMRSPVEGKPDRVVMYPTPGYSYLSDLNSQINGSGPPFEVRGFFEINDTVYFVYGNQLCSLTLTVAGTGYNLVISDPYGTLNTSSGRVSIACNTVELVISDGSYGYLFNLTTHAFSTIGGGAFPATGGVTNFTYQDGYILAALNNSKTVIQSDLLAGGTYGAQAFATVTSFADNVVAVFSDELQLYIFGPKVTEVRFNSGATPFAFEKTQGVLIQAGCAAKDTIVKVGGTIMWLARDAAGKAYVAALSGYAPKVVSTPAINEVLERYTTVSDAYAHTYREGDSQFYCLTFPTENATWCYDARMDQWHERSWDYQLNRDTYNLPFAVNWSRKESEFNADLPNCYVTVNGFHLVGDRDGFLWLMSQDFVNEARSGLIMRRVRTCQHLEADGKSIFLHELWIDIETGVRAPNSPLLAVGFQDDAQATLEISRDGGHTWRSAGTQSLGNIGDYRRRLVWRRLGRSRPRMTFRLTISDAVRTYILGAGAQATAGTK